MKKIDAHTHIFMPEIIADREKYGKLDPSFILLYKDPKKSRMVTVEQLIEAMDEAGVEKSVVCTFPWRSPEVAAQTNDYIIESARRFPDRIIPFVCPPLTTPREVSRELGRLQGRNIAGFGELAFYQSGWGPATKSVFQPVLEAARELKIPVMIHLNEPVGHQYPGKTQLNLTAVYEMIQSHPEVTFIFAHFGGGLFFYELMPEVRETLVNVYYDSAAGPFLYTPEIYRVCIDIMGPKKLLFGTDFPLMKVGRYLQDLSQVNLTQDEKNLLMHANLTQILRPDQS